MENQKDIVNILLRPAMKNDKKYLKYLKWGDKDAVNLRLQNLTSNKEYIKTWLR